MLQNPLRELQEGERIRTQSCNVTCLDLCFLQMLLTGKSINFLRQVCQDRTAIRTRDVVKAAETNQGGQENSTIFKFELGPEAILLQPAFNKSTSLIFLKSIMSERNISNWIITHQSNKYGWTVILSNRNSQPASVKRLCSYECVCIAVESIFTQDMDAFPHMIDTVYKETSSHLLEVLHIKYKFMDHLKVWNTLRLKSVVKGLWHQQGIQATWNFSWFGVISQKQNIHVPV